MLYQAMDVERWVVVKGFPNYKVSSWGRVWSTYRNRCLKPQKCRGGYLIVRLYRNGKGSFQLVHRLVAKAFIPNPKNLTDVDHRDSDDKQNNAVCNLRWASRTQNCCNQKIRKNSTSGILGVSWSKHARKWKVQIKEGKKNHFIGYFAEKDRAWLARLRAEFKRNPEFMPAEHKKKLEELEKKFSTA